MIRAIRPKPLRCQPGDVCVPVSKEKQHLTVEILMPPPVFGKAFYLPNDIKHEAVTDDMWIVFVRTPMVVWESGGFKKMLQLGCGYDDQLIPIYRMSEERCIWRIRSLLKNSIWNQLNRRYSDYTI
jgi:hypothetical protein